ncbi:MAG: cupredoxin domain-containing protein [Actinomycetota bacterium]
MDPEQIYTEVLQAEQQKGSAPPVAEGRAKSARQRALNGSPHPTEPKWWPGAQPHLDGGDAAADGEAEAEEPAAEEPAAEAPEAEASGAEAPAAEAATADETDSDAAAASAPAEEGAPAPDQAPAGAPPPAAAAPAAAEQAAPAAAVAQEAPPAAKPAGVLHGTPTGNRLRPEDGVSTEAQFAGQRAMYERRKMIDELVSTGVPIVAAEDHGRRGSPALALLYILIPILAIFVLVNQEGAGTGEAAPAEAEAEGGESGGLAVVAEGFAFDTETLTLKADAANEVKFENKDTEPHNIAIYETAADGPEKVDPLFAGEIIEGGQSTDYTIEGLKAGENYFQCDVHPNMNGTVTVE